MLLLTPPQHYHFRRDQLENVKQSLAAMQCSHVLFSNSCKAWQHLGNDRSLELLLPGRRVLCTEPQPSNTSRLLEQRSIEISTAISDDVTDERAYSYLTPDHFAQFPGGCTKSRSDLMACRASIVARN